MRISIFIFLILFINACTSTNNEKVTEEVTNSEIAQSQEDTEIDHFVHTVLFWLKDADNQEDRAAFEKSITKLIENSKYIQKSHLGTAPAASRDVVDGSFTYCYVVTFKSKEDEAAYQTEPAHLTFIEESEDLWTKVIVYDSVEL